MAPNGKIGATQTSFEIIEKLVEENGAGVTQLASTLERPKSTIHEHLSTLVDLGYVISDGKKYEASLKFLQIGGILRDELPVYYIVKPELKKIAEKTGEHTSLMVEQNDYGVYVCHEEGEYTRKVVAPIGTHTMLHTSAPGKAILAHLPSKKVQTMINQYGLSSLTPNTITDQERLFSELDNIVAEGYATDKEEGYEGIQGFARPLISRENDDILGAIGAYGPASRSGNAPSKDELLQALGRAADVIELNHAHNR